MVGIFDPACELLPPWMKEPDSKLQNYKIATLPQTKMTSKDDI